MLFQKKESLISAILEKINGLNKSRKKVLLHVFILFMGLRGRYNFSNMARYGKYGEQSYRNHFEKDFDFLLFNKELIERSCSGHLILAFDPSYIPKSGKHTPLLGRFWSGCAGRTLKGLEIGGLAAVDISNNTAMPLEVIQTPSTKELEKKEMTLIDWYADIIIKRIAILITLSEYMVVDGYFAKKKFAHALCEQGLQVISKFRSDADLRYLYQGNQTGKAGRPKLYEGKVNVKQIDKTKITYCYEEENKKEGRIKVYSGIVYSKCLKRKVKIAYLEFYKNEQYKGYAILFSTDLEIDGMWLYKYYKARYQIEFLFRDSKQHAGLTHCQARSENKLHFHFNASFTTIGISKAIHYLAIPKEKRKGFSMADVKTLYLNKFIADRIFANLDIELNSPKILNIYRQTLFYGSMAA